jgi:hypothetical protein
MYIRLRDAVRRKLLEKWRANIWFLLPDNAPAHRSVLIKDFLAKHVTTLDHPTFSSGLAPARFYLLSRLKSALKGRANCDDTDGRAEKVFTKWLFINFYSRWE